MAARKRHIPRPVVPWRTQHLTICGRDLDGLEQVTREEVRAVLATIPSGATIGWEAVPGLRIEALASARICRTCTDDASRFRSWDLDPSGVIRTEADRSVNWFSRDRVVPSPLDLELRAIADLIAGHRGEFDDLLERYQVLACLTGTPARTTRRTAGR